MAKDAWYSKVNWTSAAGIVGTLLLWYAGKITEPAALSAIWAALQVLFFRDTVAQRLDKVHAATVAVAATTANVAAARGDGT